MDRTNPRLQAVSGQGMDRVIPRRPRWRRAALVAAIATAAAAAAFFLFRPEPGRSLAVDPARVETARVVRGRFDDFIQVRARATPARTVFIDTAQGGQVEAIHVEDGALVQPGQLLVELSNAGLQLDVISREAQITEQLNALRGLELAHEQNRLAHKREMVEVDYQIARLTRQSARSDELAESGVVARGEQEDRAEELSYYKRRHKVQLESFAAADRLQRAQVVQLRAASIQLERNLGVARHNLETLQVKASIGGRLSAFTLEVGQSLAAGDRIGQIDDPSRYKMTAEIDEFYLNRVDTGQQGELGLDERTYRLKVARIRPQVQNGRFEADLVFDGDTPAGIRRGQTMQATLQLGQPSEAVLVPNSAFYHDTGGSWVFVVSTDRRQAVRRTVRLGRRNPQFIEVLEGLQPGEEIVTSAYSNYRDTDRLDLQP
jgi:HlyD family secretion protein